MHLFNLFAARSPLNKSEEVFKNMDHMWHSRKFRLVAAAVLILLALTCYFWWEILYQERAILNILRMSKDGDDGDRVETALNSDHLEEVVDAWLEGKKREVNVTGYFCIVWIQIWAWNVCAVLLRSRSWSQSDHGNVPIKWAKSYSDLKPMGVKGFFL